MAGLFLPSFTPEFPSADDVVVLGDVFTDLTADDFGTGADAPHDVVNLVADVGTNSVTVHWDLPPDGPDITSIEVVSSDGTLRALDPTVTSVVFTGLNSGVIYQFTVYTLNDTSISPGATTVPVAPLAFYNPDGVAGPIIAPIPTPEDWIRPVYRPPSTQSTARPAGGNDGNIVFMHLFDDVTQDILRLSPRQTGLGITDFDPGFPAIRETSSNLPGRSGTYDSTAFLGQSAVSLSLLAMDAPDVNGIHRPASWWVDVLATWCHPARRPRLVWQTQGSLVKQANLRASQFTAPYTGSGTGRSAISVQVQWKNPDGVIYAHSDEPNSSFTPLDGRKEINLNAAANSGAGITFPISFPVAFPIISGGLGSIDYVGQVPAYVELSMFGGATSPEFVLEQSYDGTNWNVIPSKVLNFSGLTVAPTDILQIITGPSPSAVTIASSGARTNVRKFLGQPPQWFTLNPGVKNRIRFNSGTSASNTTAYAFFYDTFLR